MLTKKTIEKILFIALDNGFSKHNISKKHIEISIKKISYDVTHWDIIKGSNVNLIELITSKEFIDSIVRYMIYKKIEGMDGSRMTYWTKTHQQDYIEKQAQAIYNGTLEEFFKSIIEN